MDQPTAVPLKSSKPPVKKPGKMKPPTSKVKPPKFKSDAIAEKMLDDAPGA